MSRVLTPSWLKRHDVLASWIGCFLGGWGGLGLAHIIGRAIAWTRPTVETDGLQEMTEGLMLMPLLGLAFLVGAAAGVALLLRVLRMNRPVATGVVTSLCLMGAIPILLVVGSMLTIPTWSFSGSRLVTAIAALLSAQIGLLLIRGSRKPNRSPSETSSPVS